MKGMVIALASVLLVCVSIGFSYAQEEDMEFSYGTVVSVSGNQVVVSEYDYDQDAETELTYTADPAATFEGVNSVKEIAKGDIIEIDYEVKNGKNIAKRIFVEKDIQEEMVPSDVYDEPVPDNLPEEMEY